MIAVRDSRFWRYVPEGDVLGRAALVYFSREEPALPDRIRWESIGQRLR